MIKTNNRTLTISPIHTGGETISMALPANINRIKNKSPKLIFDGYFFMKFNIIPYSNV